MSPLLLDRLEAVKDIPLSVGSHNSPPDDCAPGEFCDREAFAYVTGQQWTDDPDNCSPVLSAFLRRFQDRTDQPGRDALKAWTLDPSNVARQEATANDEHDQARGFMACDWACRVALRGGCAGGGLNPAKCQQNPHFQRKTTARKP